MATVEEIRSVFSTYFTPDYTGQLDEDLIQKILKLYEEEKIGSKAGTLLIIQGVSSCLLLGLSGIILFFQGWRLDSVLQFCVFLQTIIIIYFALRDIFIFTVKIFPQNKSSED